MNEKLKIEAPEGKFQVSEVGSIDPQNELAKSIVSDVETETE